MELITTNMVISNIQKAIREIQWSEIGDETVANTEEVKNIH